MILPRYQITASGLYQLPWGINAAANLVAREGYGMPFFEPVEAADPVLPEKRVLLVDPRESRLPASTSLDLRGEKALTFGSRELVLTLDLFNAFNASTVLGKPVRRDRRRQHRLQPADRDHEPAPATVRRAVPVLAFSGRL